MDGVDFFYGVGLSNKIGTNTHSLQLMACMLHATWRRRPTGKNGEKLWIY